jgi:cell volume regulation protein A
MISIEKIFIATAVFLVLSVLGSKASEKYGIPALLLFLFLGMLAGSEGPGGIYFDDPWLAQSLGVTALTFILFSGGLDTKWPDVRPVALSGFFLSTIGVALTALVIGAAASLLLGFSLLEGMLLGSIMSSTDAAAVFSVLRARNIGLPDRIKNLLELESGSNDPMAVFLTVTLISLMTLGSSNPGAFVAQLFVTQMAVGAVGGLGLGWIMVWVVNHIRLETEGLYPALTLALVLLIYGAITYIGGNGFLGTYISGLMMGNTNFVHRNSLLRFHDAIAWLMQIVMFFILGLQVFPSRLTAVLGSGLLLAGILMLLARPSGVFFSLALSQFKLKEKLLLSWVGLRGAAPIILATFPYLAEIPNADLIFHLVFFIVLTSVLLQGTSIHLVVRALGLALPQTAKPRHPLEFEEREGIEATLMDFIVPYKSSVEGKPIVDLGLPPESVITLICRDGKYLVPSGSTILRGGDVLLILLNKASAPEVSRLLGTLHAS